VKHLDNGVLDTISLLMGSSRDYTCSEAPFWNPSYSLILIGNHLFNSLQTGWETWYSFIKDRCHGHEIFQGKFLMGVYRHSIGELHPTSMFHMKTQHLKSLVVEVDIRYKPLLKASELLSPPPPSWW
jgi:hypothetical protein